MLLANLTPIAVSKFRRFHVAYATYNPALSIYPEFPWSDALNVLNTTNLLSTAS